MLAATLLLAMAAVTAATAAMSATARGAGGTRYGFYRAMEAGAAAGGRRKGAGARRVYGGHSAALSSWGAACVLLDRFWATRCSGAVLAPYWVITAAHCVSPEVTYVKYNSRLPSGPEGSVRPVHYLYRHPGYKVVQEDEGGGLDVTVLHHDVGLVRTQHAMQLATRPALSTLDAMKLYGTTAIRNEEVEVLGFGRTERALMGEELFSARLRLVSCERGTWYHCACGVARAGDKAGAGVCAGDSGGPVVYRGTQVGVTSMGPLECASGAGAVEQGSSVFTMLAPYLAIINGTMSSADTAAGGMERLDRLSSSCALPAMARALLPAGVLLLVAR